jgi:hypothetical protein
MRREKKDDAAGRGVILMSRTGTEKKKHLFSGYLRNTFIFAQANERRCFLTHWYL